MLDDALGLLPEAKLADLAKRYLDLKALQPPRPKEDLLTAVKAFEKASLAGEFYESFNVNSRNYMEKSKGTKGWIAEFGRLLDCCLAMAKSGDPGPVLASFDILFGLLDHVDECLDDIVFFADEGGSWQVGVDWEKVLPPWYRLLAASADPDRFARRVVGMLEKHYSYGAAKMLSTARRVATPNQRTALEVELRHSKCLQGN